MGEPPFAARPCSQRGLPCRRRYRRRGGLLPHLFTLTDPGNPSPAFARGRPERQFVFCGAGCLQPLKRLEPGNYPALRSLEPGLSSSRSFRAQSGGAARPNFKINPRHPPLTIPCHPRPRLPRKNPLRPLRNSLQDPKANRTRHPRKAVRSAPPSPGNRGHGSNTGRKLSGCRNEPRSRIGQAKSYSSPYIHSL